MRIIEITVRWGAHVGSLNGSYETEPNGFGVDGWWGGTRWEALCHVQMFNEARDLAELPQDHPKDSVGIDLCG